MMNRHIIGMLLAAAFLLFSPAADGQILTGADQLMSDTACLQPLRGRRVALVGNQTSVVDSVHVADALRSSGIRIQKIFCPEHGFRGNVQAGSLIASSTDPKTGIPIVSLYGSNKKPTFAQMRDVDVVVFDLQDVGCRFYTYISTLHYVMEACAESHVPLYVLDRPNPNGHYVDGPVLERGLRSFVGMHPVPIVYGMTIGEYALMINGEYWLHDSLQCDLHVVQLSGYTHQSRYSLPVAPSPNLPNDQAVALYPSLCLFEGCNVSVGRGTEWPFQVIGSPYYKGDSTFRFKPQVVHGAAENPLFKNQTCRGLDLREAEVQPCFDLGYLREMYRGNGQHEFFLSNNFFEKLAGTTRLRSQIKQGLTDEQIRQSWEPALSEFKAIREKYLLYE